MSQKKAAFLIVDVTLFLVGTLIVSSSLFADTGYAQTATFMLSVLGFIPFW